jgi:hypothetical protein
MFRNGTIGGRAIVTEAEVLGARSIILRLNEASPLA